MSGFFTSIYRMPLCAVAVAAGALAAPVAAHAADAYPNRPVTMVVPFTPGGGTDNVARLLGDRLSKELGQSVIIDNRGGASGTIGTTSVANAQADGYRLLFTSSAPITIAPNMPDNKLQYDPVQDFEPIAMVAQQPVLIVVNAKSPAKTLEELVSLSKSATDGLTYGSPGPGTELHMTGELFKQTTGAKLLHIPYKGGNPAITDLLAGHIDTLMVVTSSIFPHIDSGAVRALATTDAERVAMLPDVPTTAELGMPELNATAWWGVFAPKGTPQDVLDRLSKDIETTLNDEAFQKRLLAAGAEPSYVPSGEFASRIESELDKWQQVVKQADLRAE